MIQIYQILRGHDLLACYCTLYTVHCTLYTAALRTDKKRQYWKTAVKEVIMYSQEKAYTGLENQQRYWGKQ